MIVSTGFHYDNEYSEHKGVIKVRTSGGLVTETFLSSATNQVIKLKNGHKSFIQETERESLVIPMALYFEENLDETMIRSIKRWLTQDDFKELVFEDQPNRVYYAKIDGETNLSHNSISSGYVEFSFLTNSSYAFSREVEIEGDSDNEYTHLQIFNEGDMTTYPTIKIVMNPESPTDIEIFNDTAGDYLLLKNNLENETILILNEYEEFETSSSLRYCYDDHIGGFIQLVEGVNELRLKGNFTFTITYQNIYL